MAMVDELAGFVVSVSYEQLSEAARAQAKIRILDALGCQRFYPKSLYKSIKGIDRFRNEDNLNGELRKLYLEILKHRKETRFQIGKSNFVAKF